MKLPDFMVRFLRQVLNVEKMEAKRQQELQRKKQECIERMFHFIQRRKG